MVLLHYLLGSIGEVLLDLIIGKFENLEAVGEGSLCCLSLGKVVDNLLVSVGLLDVVVIEVDDGVAIGEHLPLHSIVEDHFLLPVLVDTLDLPVVADDLLDHLQVRRVLVVILQRELHVELLRVLFVVRRRVLMMSLRAGLNVGRNLAHVLLVVVRLIQIPLIFSRNLLSILLFFILLILTLVLIITVILILLVVVLFLHIGPSSSDHRVVELSGRHRSPLLLLVLEYPFRLLLLRLLLVVKRVSILLCQLLSAITNRLLLLLLLPSDLLAHVL